MTRQQMVLRWVNRQREKYGLGEPLTELPKGERNSSCRCPVARSLPSKFTDVMARSGSSLWTDIASFEPQIHIGHPKYVQEFIIAFDAGRIPELVA